MITLPKSLILEEELVTLGSLVESCRVKTVSLSAALRDRLLRARRWASASNMSGATFNFYLNEGASQYRKQPRGWFQCLTSLFR